jgi:hypothetical protein
VLFGNTLVGQSQLAADILRIAHPSGIGVAEIHGVSENLSRSTNDKPDMLSTSQLDARYTHSRFMLIRLAKMSYTERDLS